MTDPQKTYSGTYDTESKHPLGAGLLDAAISDFEAIATRFGTDAIKDSSTRARYMAHVKQISEQVRREVDYRNMTVREGAEYCNQMRDKLFVEYRKFTSAVGVAYAEKLKLSSRGFDYYLNKYAQKSFQRNFTELTERERGEIYYEVIKSAGRANASVNSKVKMLRIRGNVFLLVTAILATGEIVGAKDKVKAAARQGSVIAGGMLGGGLAGLGVSFVCGPAEPACAVALVLIGSNLGAMAGEAANDAYQEELSEFMRWMRK